MKTLTFILVIAAVTKFMGGLESRAAQLVTASSTGPSSISAGGNSFAPTFSGNGQRIAFVSHAGNLVTNTTLQEPLQVFVRDLVASNTVLVSVSTNGRAGDANSFGPMLSSNGQFVVFTSEAGGLVSNDTNGLTDVFVHNLTSHTTALVSVDLSGNSPNARPSGNPLISADGQWVFFESRASNLTGVPDDFGSIDMDVFARNLQTNFTFVVSLDVTGTAAAQGDSTLACISDDGRYVGFISTATNIAAGGTNAAGDLYRRDMMTGERYCASKNVGALVPGSYRCVNALLSANGRYAAFATTGASNAVFRHDFDSDVTTLVSLRATNAEGAVWVSADGRYVTFDDGTNVFRFDANTALNELVNVTTTGAAPLSGIARNPVTTPDGSGIAFISNCPDLVTNSSTLFQVYARDMIVGRTRLLTVATNGQPSATNSEASLIAVARDFSRIAFDTTAADLIQGDGNRASDVFAYHVSTETTALVSSRDALLPRGSGLGHAFVGSDCVSTNGRFITFTSYDTDVAPNDGNARPDVFVRDMIADTAASTGISSNGARSPAISGNGRYVAHLRRTTLSPPTTSGGEVWRFDRVSGTNELVAPSSSSVGPAISSDGNLIAFLFNGALRLVDVAQGSNEMIASAQILLNRDVFNYRDAMFTADTRFLLFASTSVLAPNATGKRNLYAWDRIQRQTQLVSQFNELDTSASGPIAVATNSRFVAYQSGASLYLRDLIAGTNQLLRSGASNPALNGDGSLAVFMDTSNRLFALNIQTSEESLVADTGGTPYIPVLSADSRFVVYTRRLSIGSTDTWQLDVRDRRLGTSTLVSSGLTCSNANARVSQPVLASDGRTVVFHSGASDLVSSDFNDKHDVFVLKLGGTDTEGDGMDDDWEVAYFSDLSRDGGGDFDGDGAGDLNEFLAGTDPTNNGSVFRVLTVSPIGGGLTQVIWNAAPGRGYRVEYKNDISAIGWTSLDRTIAWNGTTASVTDPSTSGDRYYRVVRLP